MKKTTEESVIVYRMLNNAKLTKMEDNEKFLVIRLMKELKPIANSYDEFIKDAAEKLKPEGIDEINAKMQEGKELSKEEKEVFDKFNRDVTECVQKELKKEHEINAELLSEEAMKHFMSSNDFSVAEIMALYDFMVA